MPNITLIIQPPFQVPGRALCFSGSPFAIKVQRVLQYKRLPFEVEEVGWLERAQRLPALAASRKLPVLRYDGEQIEDSTVIAHELEARHARPALIPADPLLAARCHFLEEWADEALYWYGLDRQGVGRYPPAKVQADVHRGLDALLTFISDIGAAPAPIRGSKPSCRRVRLLRRGWHG